MESACVNILTGIDCLPTSSWWAGMLWYQFVSNISVHPCDKESNGGCSHTCNKEGDKSSCECPEGYEMTDDEKTCKKIHPCDKVTKGGCDQTCTKDGENAICSCKPVDFKLGEDGKSCEIVHPCDKPTKGGCEQVCGKKGDEALCGCNEGYRISKEDAKKCEKSKWKCNCFLFAFGKVVSLIEPFI